MAAGSDEIKIVVRMKDFATRAFAKLGSTIAGFAKRSVKSIFSLKAGIAAFGAGFAALRLTERAANIESIEIAFGNLTRKIGGASAVLDALRQGTRGTVSDFRLMEVANRAIILGVGESAEQMRLFTTLARRLGRAVGRDTVDAFNDLALGIGRQSRLILDNLGLIVKVGDANRVMAESLGVTVNELTDAEKRQAFLTAAMEAARIKVAELGEDTWTLADALGRFKAAIANTADTVLRALTPALTEMIQWINDLTTKHRPAILNAIADIVEAFGQAGKAIITTFDSIAQEIDKLPIRLKIATKDLAAWRHIWEGIIGQGVDRELAKWNIEMDHLLRELADIEKGGSFAKLGANIELASKTAAEKIRAFGNVLADSAEKEKDLAAATWEFIGPIEEIYGPIDKAAEQVERLNEEFERGKQKLTEYQEKYKDFIEILKAFEKSGKAQEEEKSRTSAIQGAKDAFKALRKESEAWGTATKNTILDVADAMSSRLTDGIIEMADNFKKAGRAAEAMGKQILRDIQRIIVQMLVMKGVQAGLGALGGLIPLGGGGIVPGKLRPAVVSGRLAGGRKVTHRGYYELAERGQPEVVLPMHGGAVRAEIRGGSQRLTSTPKTEVNLSFHYAPSFVTSAEETKLLERNAKFIATTVAGEVQRSLQLQEAWRR